MLMKLSIGEEAAGDVVWIDELLGTLRFMVFLPAAVGLRQLISVCRALNKERQIGLRQLQNERNKSSSEAS
jgi:hypothetical protein